MNSQVWGQMHVNGAQIEFRDEGSGQAVVFVHGAMGEECTAVLGDPVWTTGYRVIHYHRRGYGNSTRPEAPVSMGAAMQRLSGFTAAHGGSASSLCRSVLWCGYHPADNQGLSRSSAYRCFAGTRASFSDG